MVSQNLFSHSSVGTHDVVVALLSPILLCGGANSACLLSVLGSRLGGCLGSRYPIVGMQSCRRCVILTITQSFISLLSLISVWMSFVLIDDSRAGRSLLFSFICFIVLSFGRPLSMTARRLSAGSRNLQPSWLVEGLRQIMMFILNYCHQGIPGPWSSF